MKTSYNIGRVAGIDINIHITWLFIFALLAYSLATDYFPLTYKFSLLTNWMLGILAAALLFVSVIVHELSHSIVSKRNKMHVENITLFFFGGVSNVAPEEFGPKPELKVAIAGPIMSVITGYFFFVLFQLHPGAQLTAIFDYLYKINFALAAFNMIPGYPLDGGRVLRSTLWIYYKDIKKATRIASRVGIFMGYAMVLYGFASIFTGGFGLWYILLGAFLVFLAKAGYEQVVVKERLSKVPVRSLVKRANFVNPNLAVEGFVKWCEKHSISAALVRQKDSFYVVELEQAASLRREAWKKAKVRDIMKRANAISDADNAYKLFYRMRMDNVRVVPVLIKGKFVGVVTEQDILHRVRVQSMRDGA
jgi:Zn-dependent protease/predicted transcriptional regulator